jgi:hypothetical protein
METYYIITVEFPLMAETNEIAIRTYIKVLFLGIIVFPIIILGSKAEGLLSTISGIIIAIIAVYALYLIFWVGGSICDEVYAQKYPNREPKLNGPISGSEKDVASVVFGSLLFTLLFGLIMGGTIMWLSGLL